MTHSLTITLADAADLAWAQATVTTSHYLHAPVDPRARPMAYVIRRDDWRAGPSGKYGWAWRLPAPQWSWQDLTDIQPRTMRMF